MRLLGGFLLVMLAVASTQGQFSGIQLNNLQSLLSYSSQIQGFINQLNTVLPQLSNILSSTQLQSLRDQIVGLVLSQAANYPTIDGLKDMLRPLLQQYLGTSTQSRIDTDAVLQQIANIAGSILPGLLIGLIGKRDVASMQDRTLEQLLALEPGKLSQLQTQLTNIVLQGSTNNWSSSAIAQAIQQLFTQYVPSLATARIDWEQVGQSALNGLTSALPSVLIGLVGLIGKRDVASVQDRTLEQLLALEPGKLSQLQTQLTNIVLQGSTNNWSSSAIAQAIQQLFTQYVPSLATARIDWEQVGQSALDGLASALPSVLIGLVSLFGKRDTSFDLQQILSVLPTNQIIQLFQAALNSDKFAALTKLRDLFRQFLPSYSVRINFDDLANNFFNQLNTLIPNLNQAIMTAIMG